MKTVAAIYTAFTIIEPTKTLFAELVPGHRLVSEVIGPAPQIAPKKHESSVLWQGGKRCCGRPEWQWCILPAG